MHLNLIHLKETGGTECVSIYQVPGANYPSLVEVTEVQTEMQKTEGETRLCWGSGLYREKETPAVHVHSLDPTPASWDLRPKYSRIHKFDSVATPRVAAVTSFPLSLGKGLRLTLNMLFHVSLGDPDRSV